MSGWEREYRAQYRPTGNRHLNARGETEISVQGSLIQADHNKLTALSRRICQELFGQDWDDLPISDWPHIASYYVAKQLRKADPESDVAKVVVAAMYELMAPYSSYMQQLKAGFYGRQKQSQQAEQASGERSPGDEEEQDH